MTRTCQAYRSLGRRKSVHWIPNTESQIPMWKLSESRETNSEPSVQFPPSYYALFACVFFVVILTFYFSVHLSSSSISLYFLFYICSILAKKGNYKEDGVSLFITIPMEKIRVHGHKSQQQRFHLNIRQNYFHRSIIHWNNLLRFLSRVPTTGDFQGVVAQEMLDQVIFWGHFQPEMCYESIICHLVCTNNLWILLITGYLYIRPHV